MPPKPKISQPLTPKNQKIAVRVLLSILVLLVIWFFIWLKDWKDEVIGFFSKKSTTGSKATGASLSGSGSSSGSGTLNFYTTVKKYEGTGESYYQYRAAEASMIWSINHQMNKVASVQTFDLAGNQIYGTVSHNMEEKLNPETNQMEWVVNTTNITFDSPQAGFAIFT